jgi:clan AA aspartic protease
VIRGQVTSQRRAVISLQLVDATGLLVDIEAYVDTGFSGFLTLPLELIQVLQLPYDGSDIFTLAGDSEVEFDLYQVTLIWDGGDRKVRVLAAAGTPLIGMSLLEGFHLFMDVVAGGEVRIEQRP